MEIDSEFAWVFKGRSRLTDTAFPLQILNRDS